jgi:long-chain acyl-CoA synthetase
MNISDGIIEGSRIFPDKTALSFEGQELTYAELEELSAHASSHLSGLGIGKGDRVALVLGNVPAFPVWYYGILRLGAIAVSVNTRLTGEEVEFIVSDCGAKAVVVIGVEDDSIPSFSGAAAVSVTEDGKTAGGIPLRDGERIGKGECAGTGPDDPGIILYTSGTTGFPKGATLSHKNVRATVHAFNHLCGMTPDDQLLLMVPLFHCYGQNALLNAGLNVGATIVMQRVFDLHESIRMIQDHRVTKLFGVPTTFQLMLDACEPGEIDSIDYFFCAAATLAPQLGAAWQEKFKKPIYEGYGLTETAPFASYNHRLRHVPGSIGVPVDLVEMKVVDPETGKTCGPNEPGEIAVRGPNVMLGYWNRPEETAEAVRDGWFYSGDVGKVDENGYFYIVDRIKDMIAVGALKVFPSEVERVLLDAPGVADCAVVGLPDPTLGEEVVVFVVPAEGVEPDAERIRAYSLEHLAPYKAPTKVLFLEELPRNPAGKVLKKELRKEYGGESSDSNTSVTSGEKPAENDPDSLLNVLIHSHASSRERILMDFLQEEIRVLTGADAPPSVETALLETGMDSLTMVTLAKNLQSQLGSQLDLPATLVFDYPRICDLSGYLLGALPLDGPAVTGVTAFDRPEETFGAIDDMSEEEAMEALRKELEG